MERTAGEPNDGTRDMKLVVTGLSNADRLDVPDFIAPGEFSFGQPQDSEALGEPFTIALAIVLTAGATKGLIAFLAARSADRRETRTEVDVEITHPDGRLERRRIMVEDKGQGMSAELAKALGDFTGIPLKDLIT